MSDIPPALPPAPAPPAPPAPPAQPPAQPPAPPAEPPRMFSQEDVNRFLAQERRQEAQRIAGQLGVADLDEAKRLADAARQAATDALTAEQRQAAELEQLRQEAAAATATAAQVRAEADLKLDLIAAGVAAGDAAVFWPSIGIVAGEEAEARRARIAAFLEQHPTLIAAPSTEPPPPAPPAPPGPGLPTPPAPPTGVPAGETDHERGARLAREQAHLFRP